MARIALVLPAFAVLLAACGGGGSATGGGGRTGPVTGAPSFPPSWAAAEPLTEHAGDPLSREGAVQADLMGMSRIRGERWPVRRPPEPINPVNGLPPLSDPEEPPRTLRFDYAMTCEPTSGGCQATPLGPPGSDIARAGGQGGVVAEYTLDEHARWSSRSGENRIVFHDRVSGIHVMESRDWRTSPRSDDPATRSWGAWQEHSGFALIGAWTREDPMEGEQWGFRTAWARAQFAGRASGSPPEAIPGRFIWKGVMTGMHMGGRSNDWTPLAGQATLTWHHEGNGTGEIGAAFTGLRSLVRGPAWTGRSRIDFRPVPVDAEGRFGDAGRLASGNYIRGAFFGEDHAEVAGIFEQGGIIGAFGAERQ